MESQEEKGGAEASEKQNPRMVHYYYINYKQFANVVKYKLHQMRMKLEAEDSRAVNVWRFCFCGVFVYKRLTPGLCILKHRISHL